MAALARAELAKEDTEKPFQVMAVAEGHGCDWAKIGAADEDLTLCLVKDVPINGRILDPDGRPVAGAKLTVTEVIAPQDLGAYLASFPKGEAYPFTKRWDGPLPVRPAAVTTGKDGRFRLAGAGRERIVAFRLEGPAIASVSLYFMTRAAATVAGGNRHTGWWRFYGASSDYLAIAARPIRGVVRDKETGKPLAGVAVAHYLGQGPETITDQNGRYELLGLVKAAHYSLTVKPPDGLYFARSARFEDTAGFDALTGDIELVRWLTVRGRVRDKATGKPIAQARVDYHPLGGNPNVNVKLPGSWDPRAEMMTGPDGSYALTVLPGPGVLGVTGRRREAYMPAAVPLRERKAFFKSVLVDDKEEDYLTRAAGADSFGAISMENYNALVLLEPDEKEETLRQDVVLELPQERKGRVVGPDGQPLAGATVIGLAPYHATIETLKGAEFTVRGVNPRANRPLVFYHPDKNLGCFVKELRGDPSGLLTVKLQPCGSASGRVVDPDGQPVAGLRLHVPGRATRWMGEGRSVLTDKEGRFRAVGLVPGQEYWVWEPGGFPRVFARVVLEPGQNKDMGDIKLNERGE
jgi:protocatechuate 3,4-dioxygenase beta subunit